MAKANRVHSTPKSTTSSRTPKASRSPLPADMRKLAVEADKLLHAYRCAASVERYIRRRIGEDNCRDAVIRNPVRFRALFHDSNFDSLAQIKKACATVRKNASFAIKNEVKKAKAKGRHPQLAREAYSIVDHERRKLRQLPEARAHLIKEFLAEERRLAKLSRSSGHGEAFTAMLKAQSAALRATKAVLEARPKSAADAVTLLKFVTDRVLMSTRSDLRIFDLDAEVCAPLYRAHDTLDLALKTAASKT